MKPNLHSVNTRHRSFRAWYGLGCKHITKPVTHKLIKQWPDFTVKPAKQRCHVKDHSTDSPHQEAPYQSSNMEDATLDPQNKLLYSRFGFSYSQYNYASCFIYMNTYLIDCCHVHAMCSYCFVNHGDMITALLVRRPQNQLESWQHDTND